LVFASARDRVVSHAHPCEALSGLQQFNIETFSRLAAALAVPKQCRIVGGESLKEAAWQTIDLFAHAVTLHAAGSCNWPGGVIRSPLVRGRFCG
jgi:hypothetical protein